MNLTNLTRHEPTRSTGTTPTRIDLLRCASVLFSLEVSMDVELVERERERYLDVRKAHAEPQPASKRVCCVPVPCLRTSHAALGSGAYLWRPSGDQTR